jgi:amino acid adenylation domain-containing protein
MTKTLETSLAVSELLALLHNRNITVRLEGEQLRITAPAGVMTPELKQLLTLHKAALQDLLRGAAETPVIPVLPRPGPFPLSFAQQRLWFLEQLEPGEPTYNQSNLFRLRGALDVSALEQAFTTLVTRHEALRTVVRSQDGVPYQFIQPPAALTLPIIDLADLPAAGRMETALARARSELRRPFDLTSDLMVRICLLRLAADDHLLVASTHHIASDGWSLNIFWREFARLYTGYVTQASVTLPELPIQYADFAVWQRQWLSGEQLERQLGYWQRTLAGLTPLTLPTDRPRPAVLSQQGDSADFRLEPELTQRLRQLAHQEGMTPFMVLLAAFQVLLYRYSGQDDVAVGTAIANRNRAAIEGLVGFFVNTLVIRTDMAGNPGFRSLLQRVRQTALDAFDHQDLPFEKLVEELQPERQHNRHPLFQVMVFQVLTGEAQALALPGIQMEPLRVELNTNKFDLALALREDDSQTHGRLSYNTDLFDVATIARMIGHFQTLLAAVVADPDRPIGQLPLLTAAEREQLLVTWNATDRPYPRDATLPALFERQAAAHPAAVALYWGEQAITYAELNRRANGLAQMLRRQGIETGAVVGLCLRRSPEMIVALLAILKAGAAYAPLDPAFPPARLAFMAADAAVALILTEATLAPRLHESGVRLVLVDDLLCEVAVASDNPAPTESVAADSAASATDPAYIMYTSGSTGQPKGVASSHRAVARLVCNVDYVTLGREQVLLQLAPLAFDASTFEIWGALLHGSPLVLAPDGLPDYAELEALIVRRRVSVLWLTTGLFNSIVDQRVQMLHDIPVVLTGGQTISIEHVRRAQEQLPNTALIHCYGPTENTTFTCTYPIPRPLPAATASIPIGRPIPNTQVYILDAHLEPAPIGVMGELYTGGDGVASGYLRRPALSAVHFVAHPFRPGELLYRTGDLARWRSDGVVEFIGRRDRQVKLRGYRIEPGEIEAALRLHPAVRDAVVIAQQHADDQRLVAYLVVDPLQQPSPAALRSALSARLPEYMVPAAFVFVDAIPLTANGKTDVQALRTQPATVQTPARGAAPPRDDLERQLVHIWEHVLAQRPIGVEDDFFDLGGHSLLAVKLLDKIERATGRRLPLTVLFATPTVAALAQALRDRAWQPDWSALVAIRPQGSRIPLFLAPPGGSSALRFRPLVSHLSEEQPVYAFHPIGLDDDRAPHSTVEAMATYYVQALRRFLPDGPYLIGGMCFGAHVAVEMARQLEAAGDRVTAVISLDATPPANGPTWQAAPPVEQDFQYYVRQAQAFRRANRLLRATFASAAIRFRRMMRFAHARASGAELRRQRLSQAHLVAQRAFQAQRIQAPLMLLQSEQRAQNSASQARWASLTDDVVIDVVPGTTHQDLLLQEPYISQLASLLDERLARLAVER